jgi:hypothetical protein
MSDARRIEEIFAAACLGAETEAEFTADLRTFLESRGLDDDDVKAILAAPPRLALYRRLVRNNLTGVTEKMLRRTRVRMNSALDGAFDQAFASFLDEVGPRSHYLRDVPAAFLEWAEPRWRGRAELPAWIADLARHELAEFQVAAAEAPELSPEVSDVSADRPLVFVTPIRLMRFTYAVHELPADESDRSEPIARPTAILLYRDDAHAVQSLELTPFAAAITERLLAGEALLDAVRAAATSEHVAAVDARMNIAQFLADLGERGVLLGGRP